MNETGVTASNQPESGRADSASRPRVVIAEDFMLIQENIRKVVQPHCTVLATVEDGESALRAVEAHAPDILLLDVSLPDMSGFDVLEKLLGSGSSVKVILLTAHADPTYVRIAFERGAKGYVVKGRMWTDLPAAIRQVTSGGDSAPPLDPQGRNET